MLKAVWSITTAVSVEEWGATKHLSNHKQPNFDLVKRVCEAKRQIFFIYLATVIQI